MPTSLSEFFAALVASYEPSHLVREHLAHQPLHGSALTVLALGKAAVSMAQGAREALGGRIHAEVVVAPFIPSGSPPGWIESAHPTPDANSVKAAQALLAAARESIGPVLVLISGGGSALAALPAPGLSLADKAALLTQVYGAGANIEELNVVRKHLSAFKGGQLASAASSPVRTLVLSDVLGDSLSVVASGPTVPDASTFADAWQIVQRLCGEDCKGAAASHLRLGVAGLREETPTQARPGDEAILLAGIRSFVAFAEAAARTKFTNVLAMPDLFEGRVQCVAEALASQILSAAPEPALWIFGGEATIALPPSPGSGGRAQHLALLLAEKIAGRANLQILAAGSDGIDGNSIAAGAVVDGTTWSAIRKAGIDPHEALRTADSARALAAVDAQIVTGPTGCNHADLVLVQFS